MMNFPAAARTHKTQGIRVLQSILMGCALCAAIDGSAAGGSSDATYQVSVQKWMNTYFPYLEDHKLSDDGTFNAPMIWLFGPDGSMVQVVTVDDDPDLSKLKRAFPFEATPKPLAGRPSFAQVGELIKQAVGSEPAPVTGTDIWHSVLFLSNSPDCAHCASFDRGIGELEKRMTGRLKVVRITISS